MPQKKNGPTPSGGRAASGLSPTRLLQQIERLRRELVCARRLASHDSLTGLPNRTLMLDRLRQALSQAPRQHKAVGVLFIDLDNFKRVNDNLGHSTGDAVLRRVARRLLSSIRACDTVCRYGGDEFIILLPEMRGMDEVEKVRQKILHHFSEPHRLGSEVVVVRASIGSAVFGRDAANCEDLIAAADAAMYRAKRVRQRVGTSPHCAAWRSEGSLRVKGAGRRPPS
jgi:diguanylate cyclase (GGDEF)-like protein